MEKFENETPINYGLWNNLINEPEIFGPTYYFRERTWYLDARCSDDPRAIIGLSSELQLPDKWRRVPIPQEVVARFNLRTPPEPPYFIH